MNYKALIAVELDSAKQLQASGDVSAETLDKIEAHLNRADELKAQAVRAEAIEKKLGASLADLEKAEPRKVVTQPSSISVIKDESDKIISDPKKGFASDRHFFKAVMEASRYGRADKRLDLLATVGSDEQQTGSDSAGGFLVPVAFSPNLLKLDPEMDPMAGRTTNIPMSAPSINIPARVDKTHTSSVSGGFRAYWGDETQAPASSTGVFEQINLKVNPLRGIAYASEEILSDSPISVAGIISAGFQSETTSELIDARINGTGVGMPEGIMASGAKVAVAKEGSQTATTINGQNIIKMRARSWGYQNAIWIANHDTYTNLLSAHVAGTNGDIFLFAPGIGIDAPDTLLGRPIVFSEYAKTLGLEGDLILVNWSQYLEGIYSQFETAESMHVRFVNHEKAFRFSSRRDGKCWWTSALTPKNSTATLSPIVTLAVRA